MPLFVLSGIALYALRRGSGAYLVGALNDCHFRFCLGRLFLSHPRCGLNESVMATLMVHCWHSGRTISTDGMPLAEILRDGPTLMVSGNAVSVVVAHLAHLCWIRN